MSVTVLLDPLLYTIQQKSLQKSASKYHLAPISKVTKVIKPKQTALKKVSAVLQRPASHIKNSHLNCNKHVFFGNFLLNFGQKFK